MATRAFAVFGLTAVVGLAAAGSVRPGTPTWVSGGPEGGVYAVAVAPGVVYAATGDGIYTSASWGKAWRRVSSGLPEKFATAVAVDPGDPRVVYAGTTGGVFKSVDGGGSWTLSTARVRLPAALAMAPSSPRTVYALTGLGPFDLWRTANGGADWTRVAKRLRGGGFAHVGGFAVDPASPRRIYWGDANEGLRVSADGGRSWGRRLAAAIHSIAVDTTTTHKLYAGGGTSAHEPRAKIYTSLDAGEHWRTLSTLQGPSPVPALAVDTGIPGVLYAATTWGVHRSIDAGKTFRLVGKLGDQPRRLAVDPAHSGRLLAGSDSLWRSLDGGTTWADANRGLVATTMTALAVGPSQNTRLAVASDFRGHVFSSSDGGTTWRALGKAPAGGLALAVDPQRPTTLYAGGYGVAKSTDGGRTWQRLKLGYREARALIIDPKRPSTVYAGTSDGVFKSTNGGASWRRTSSGLAQPNPHLGTPRSILLAIDPGRTTTLYAAVNTKANGLIFKTTGGGAHWQRLSDLNLDSYVYGIAVDPEDPRTVYLATDAGIRRSDDGGLTWEQGASLFAGGGIVVDPVRPGTIYAATWDDVFLSTDRGVTFRRVSGRLRGGLEYGLAIDARGQRLYACTYGHGVSVARLPLVGPQSR